MTLRVEAHLFLDAYHRKSVQQKNRLAIYRYKSQQLNNASKTKTTHASQIGRVP